jgi:hypothetical protein
VRIIILKVDGQLFWRIAREAEPIFRLSREPNFAILNPLLNLGLPFWSGREEPQALVGNEVFLNTDAVGFVVPDEFEIEGSPARAQEFYSLFSNACRFASKQYNMPRRIVQLAPFKLEILPDLIFPRQGNEEKFLNTYFYGAALSWGHLARVDQLLNSCGIPVFHDILLDSFQSYDRRDYRHAILYSAMAIESMASEVMGKSFQALLEAEVPSTCWRLVDLDIAGGGKVRKDPIYEYLTSRDDFGALLHERPLYLLQRSLMVEDQELYRVARELYKTRNKIVHRGGVATSESGTLQESQEGAEAALNCAVKIFRWFGVESDYVFPCLGFIAGHSCGWTGVDPEVPSPDAARDGR